MNHDDLRVQVLRVLREIAPDASLERLDPDTAFRDQFEFDSMDFLDFALGLEKHLEIKIPEVDYPKLASLNGCLAYLPSRFTR